MRLLRSAIYILHEQGPTGLFRRVTAWLRGERGYVNTLIEEAWSTARTYEEFLGQFEPPPHPKLTEFPTFDIFYQPQSDADLSDLLINLKSQIYPHWRLLNAGETPTADYVMRLESGDRLARWALHHFAAAVKDRPDVVYCDVDEIIDGKRQNPLFKPDWSPEMMFSVNLLRESVVRTPLALPYLNEPSWDYGFHVAESATTITHIAQVLVHRCQPPSFDGEAVKRHLLRMGIQHPTVEDGFSRWKPVKVGLVSIIIPSKDKANLLGKCLDTLFEKTILPDYEVIVVDTGSVEPETAALYQRYAGRIRIVEYREPFNFSRACNIGAKAATGDFLLFMNNDMEIVRGDWLARMAQWFDVPGIGAVGGKLLFPDGRIQHAGVLLGFRRMADNLLAFSEEGYAGPYGSDDWYRNVLAVTGACLMVERKIFEQVGGFNEAYILVFSDVFLCTEIYNAGYRIVYSPDVRLIHHESATRSRDKKTLPPNDLKQATDYIAVWLKKGNPYFNRNLSSRMRIPTFKQDRYDTPTGMPDEI